MINRLIDETCATMPWDQFDQVVFDVGNVLLRWDPKGILNRFVPDKSRHQALLEDVFASPYWPAIDHGWLSLGEATDLFVSLHPEMEEDIRRVMVGWVPMDEVVPEGVAAIKKAQAMGKRTMILSNYSDEAFRVVEQKYDFIANCDVRIVSARVGVCKPDEKIYRILMARGDASPARTLYVDDSAVNIEKALTLGWHCLWASTPERIGRFFGE